LCPAGSSGGKLGGFGTLQRVFGPKTVVSTVFTSVNTPNLVVLRFARQENRLNGSKKSAKLFPTSRGDFWTHQEPPKRTTASPSSSTPAFEGFGELSPQKALLGAPSSPVGLFKRFPLPESELVEHSLFWATYFPIADVLVLAGLHSSVPSLKELPTPELKTREKFYFFSNTRDFLSFFYHLVHAFAI